MPGTKRNHVVGVGCAVGGGVRLGLGVAVAAGDADGPGLDVGVAVGVSESAFGPVTRSGQSVPVGCWAMTATHAMPPAARYFATPTHLAGGDERGNQSPLPW